MSKEVSADYRTPKDLHLETLDAAFPLTQLQNAFHCALFKRLYTRKI
jgi:hypothetical protein